jgi:hypothetical protein
MAADKGAGRSNAGRPTKYDPSYCQAVIDHMADGASLTSFAAEISIARSTINEWISEHPEFSEAVNIAKAKCAAWWEKVNRNIAKDGGGTGSAAACALGLKNMAADDWREKIHNEHSGPGGGPIQVARVERVIVDPATDAAD